MVHAPRAALRLPGAIVFRASGAGVIGIGVIDPSPRRGERIIAGGKRVARLPRSGVRTKEPRMGRQKIVHVQMLVRGAGIPHEVPFAPVTEITTA
jgi:hypothetical protein